MRNTARARTTHRIADNRGSRKANKRRVCRSANNRRVSRSANNRRLAHAAARYEGSPSIRNRSTREDRVQRFADRTATIVADAMQQGTVTSEDSTLATGLGYFAIAEAVRAFNTKLIEIGQANAMATLQFAEQFATAKRPSEAAIFWSSQARKRIEMLTDQSVPLAQKIMASSTQSLTHSFGKALQVLLPAARTRSVPRLASN